MIRVTVWNENIHETREENIRAIYPNGIHGCIAEFLGREEDITVRTATLDMPEQGLSEDILNDTDVLIWWAHVAHRAITDETAERVASHVKRGMGFISLHSAQGCKPVHLLLGTTMQLRWKHGDKEILICTAPAHPIAEGVPDRFTIEPEEMYGEYFDIPKPDDVVFIGWFASGEVFRSGVTFTRGRGKMFLFQPGHEEGPTFFDPSIQRIIINAVRWARPINALSEPYKTRHIE